MSAPSGPTAGERTHCANCGGEVLGGRLHRVGECHFAEPDAGDVEEVHELLTDHADCRATTDGRKTMWSCGIVTGSEAFPILARIQRDHLATALASDWLDAVRRKAGDDRAEQIAQATEDAASDRYAHARVDYDHAARIARSSR